VDRTPQPKPPTPEQRAWLDAHVISAADLMAKYYPAASRPIGRRAEKQTLPRMLGS
jgi:hypothetical protein